MNGIAVLGAGAWGTALALHLSEGAASEVVLWGRNAERMQALGESRLPGSLPGVRLPEGVRVTADLGVAASASVLVLAVPCPALRPTAEALRGRLAADVTLVVAAKGFEYPSLLMPTEVLGDVLGAATAARTVIFSGPSFALEVARGRPTSVVAASQSEALSLAVQAAFSRRRLRVYTSTDPVGVQVAGALKNVIAIAVGASDGLGFGPNTRAALITRGLSEIGRLAAALGGQAATVSGLAGLGDLVLTCTGEQSRNRSVGFGLGQGRSLGEVLAGLGQVAEGVSTVHSAVGLSRKLGVDLPISQEVYQVVVGARRPEEAVEALLSRSLKPE